MVIIVNYIPRFNLYISNNVFKGFSGKNMSYLSLSFSIRVRTGHGKSGKSWNARISFSGRPEKSWNFYFGP